MNLPCIITALSAESRPLIEHFKLQATELNGLRLHTNEHCMLITTGLGKLSAAASVAAVLQERGDITSVINVGIAGSDAPIGTQLIAGCVEDAGSGKKWYPHLPTLRALPALHTMTVQTHDKPQTQYKPELAYDMEAAGIFNAARGKLDSTAVQCLKVVSDNKSSDISKIKKVQVHQWVSSCIPAVEALIDNFYDPTLVHKAQVNDFVTATTQSVHFTSTQTHQLHRLATQHLTLHCTLPSINTTNTTAKQLLQRIGTELADIKLSYPAATIDQQAAP